MMLKKVATGACVAIVTALAAGPALAGEVQGPPGDYHHTYTPIENDIAASGCAFNGLNDYEQGQTQRITQNYGTNIQLNISREEGGFPGIGCNPAVTPPGLG